MYGGDLESEGVPALLPPLQLSMMLPKSVLEPWSQTGANKSLMTHVHTVSLYQNSYMIIVRNGPIFFNCL